MNNVHKNV